MLSACNKDIGNPGVCMVQWGTLHFTDQDTMLYGDNNETYNIVENSVSWFSYPEGQRVVVGYHEPEHYPESNPFDISVVAIDAIQTKSVLHSSDLSESDRDDFGYDPIYIYDMWLGGHESQSSGLFLNILCEVRHSGGRVPHTLNAVMNDDEASQEEKVIGIYHNAAGDGTQETSFARISFDLAGVLDSFDESAAIMVIWENYLGNRKSAMIPYPGSICSILSQYQVSGLDQRKGGNPTFEFD